MFSFYEGARRGPGSQSFSLKSVIGLGPASPAVSVASEPTNLEQEHLGHGGQGTEEAVL